MSQARSTAREGALTLQTVESELTHMGEQIAALLPPDVSQDKFQQVVLAALRQKPELLNLNRQSLFNACLAAAQDGLLPDGREGAIVPRKGIAVWQPMIAGIIKRVKSTGSVVGLVANVVYEGEAFEVLLGDDDKIVHRRDMSKVHKGQEIAVYAIATLKDGSKEREIMTWDQVMDVRQSSSMPNSGPWTEWADEMARKTVIRRLSKRLPVIEPADEALRRTIERVDNLYEFGKPAPSVEAKVRPATLEHEAASPPPPRPVEASRSPAPAPPGRDFSALTSPKGFERLAALKVLLASSTSEAEVTEVATHPGTELMLGNAPEEVRRDINALLSEAYARFQKPTETGPDWGAVDDGSSAAEPETIENDPLADVLPAGWTHEHVDMLGQEAAQLIAAYRAAPDLRALEVIRISQNTRITLGGLTHAGRSNDLRQIEAAYVERQGVLAG